MTRFALLIGAAATLALWAPVSPSHALAAQEADIVGTWVLDVERSDNPRDVMQRARSRSNDGGGERRRRRQEGGAPTPPRGPRMQASPAERALQQRVMRPVRALMITRTDSTLVLRSRDQAIGEFFLDGRRIKSGEGTDLEFEVKSEWKGNKLEIETKSPGGVSLKQKYELDREKGELKVELDYNNTRQDLRLRVKQFYTLRETES